jgi:hypothetical protein
MPAPENKKRAPKGGITFTEPFAIVFSTDCSIRLLTSGDCLSRLPDHDDQWLPLRECDLYSSYSGGTVTELHRVPFIKRLTIFLGNVTALRRPSVRRNEKLSTGRCKKLCPGQPAPCPDRRTDQGYALLPRQLAAGSLNTCAWCGASPRPAPAVLHGFFACAAYSDPAREFPLRSISF